MRVVALLALRNESLYLDRCLRHLSEQGIETWIIDNASTDGSLDIARRHLGKGVIQIEDYPYPGYYDWSGLLLRKASLARTLDADWFIHHDADEIREAPSPWATLLAALTEVDQAGYNAVNFDEFVFLPTSEDEHHDGADYVASMRYYYYFRPSPCHRVNAWRKQDVLVDLTSSGGHSVEFPGRSVYPGNFILRHYVALSSSHLARKYGVERVYSKDEIERLGWHRARARFDPSRLTLTPRERLKCLDRQGWDTSQPWASHEFLRGPDAREPV